MNIYLTTLWTLAVSGASTVGVGFIFMTFAKKGIEKAVEHNFNKHLEDYKAKLNREMELLKTSLKNAETLFAKQLEAVTALRRFFRRLVPRKNDATMEWDEACSEIFHSFSQHADQLDEIVCSYGAILPATVLRELESAVSLATDGSLEWLRDTRTGDVEPSQEGLNTADRFYDVIKAAVTALQEVVDAQVAGRARAEAANP